MKNQLQKTLLHEIGHWATARHLHFEVEDISIDIKPTEINGAARILIKPDIPDMASMERYLRDRIVILYSGLICEHYESPVQWSPETTERLFQSSAADDRQKITELTYILRGIVFCGEIHKKYEAKQLIELNTELWRKACSAVEGYFQVARNMAQELVEKKYQPQQENYCFNKRELENYWARHQERGAYA